MKHTTSYRKFIFLSFLLILFTTNLFAGSNKILITEFLAANSSTLKDSDGEYSDWIEIYNPGTTSVDLTGWGLTDSKSKLFKWIIPAISIQPNSYLVIFASGKDRNVPGAELHTNFSLSKDGEYLAIVEPNSTISDEYSPTFPVQSTDISYGKYQNVTTFFEIPTPGTPNKIETRAQLPIFSKTRGYYDASFNLSLTVTDPQTKIYYTTDGTRPTEQSLLYTAPITISRTTPLSAIGIKNGIASKIVTNTYFFITDIVNQPNNPSGYPDRWGYLGDDIKYDDYAVGERAPADYAMDQTICNATAYRNSIQAAFKSIPSISIVTNPGYLFSESTDPAEGGIYIYTGVTTGVDWERPVSIEYYEPATDKQFQLNCGLSLHGAASRQPEKTGKHSFKASFKTQYGESSLDFKLYEDKTAVEKFDHLVLRAGYNQSWLHPDSWQRTNSQYLNDSFAKRLQLSMGQTSTHDRFAHLFINGLYWGLYDVSERVSDNFMEDYFAGTETDYDVINHDGLADGETVAFDRLVELAKTGQYDQIMTEKLLNVENFIDYLIINFYIGNADWGTNNWYMARNRVEPGNGFYSFCWDSESSLTDVNINKINGGSGFQGKLRSILFGSSTGTATTGGLYNNKEFKLKFADRIQKHFFNNGTLTPEVTSQIYKTSADELDLPIILESARWGDYRRNVLRPQNSQPPVYTRNDHWIPRKESLLANYFPKRSGNVYKQFEALGLVSEIAPPAFSSYGGVVTFPFSLTMSSPTGTVYYTIDGSDPRESGSANIATSAINYQLPLQLTTSKIIKARTKNGSVWSALIEATFTDNNQTAVRNTKTEVCQVSCFKNTLQLNLPVSGDVTLELYSLDGKCLQRFQQQCNAGNNSIDISNFVRGVYLYKLYVDELMQTGKFIK